MSCALDENRVHYEAFLGSVFEFDPCSSSMASSILCEIESETRPSSDASEVPDLPSDVEPCEAAAEDTQTTCCQAGCLASLEESPHLQRRVNEMHHILQGSTADQQESLQFHCMSRWNRSHEAGWRKYQAWGMPLCTHALEFVLKLSRHKRQKFQNEIQKGALKPPLSLKATQRQRDSVAMEAADTLLSWLHNNVAETLAETRRRTPGEEAASTRESVLTYSTSAQLARELPKTTTVEHLDEFDKSEAEVRWLPPGTTLAEMRDLAQTFLPEIKTSYSTFCICYHRMWEHRLKIRHEGQHAKCNACEKFKEFRRQVSAPQDVKRVIDEYTHHLAQVMADRQLDKKLNLRSQVSVGSIPGTLEPEATLLSIHIDAMDTAKFRVPRNISAAKEFQNSWRPELTLVGAIVEGLCEHYILADLDLPKNANLQCTLLGLVLEETQQALKARGRTMPRHLRLHTDNASGEGKNQTILYLAAWLVRRGLFDSVTLSQFRVGHSHGKPDQRFSEIPTALAQSALLENPEQFAEAIAQGVKPRENRTLKTHRLQATIAFKEFFEAMALKTSGHTQTKGKTESNLEAVHVFSVTTRRMLTEEVGTHSSEPYGSCEEDDIILSCRLHLADKDWSQQPLVLATSAGPYPTRVNPRLQLSDKQRKEFEKTAWKITQSPWQMHLGSAYLLKLCQDNLDNQSDDWQLPCMDWMLTATRQDFDVKQEPAQLDARTFGITWLPQLYP